MNQQMPSDMSNENMRRRGSTYITWALLLLALFAVVAGPTLLLVVVGLVPTIVALIVDRSKQKSGAVSVGSINVIGVFPYVIDLWAGINTWHSSAEIISDVWTLLVMYSSAAFGWLLFLTLPSVISSFVMVLQQRKVAQLRGEQKDLIEEWGEDVAAIVEMQKEEAQEDHLEHAMDHIDMDGGRPHNP
ncbi:hypothetical protein V5T82_09205 [Magnetovibrio sp. PR-2]|uniref:hypothetical protein n=1 Tax=Magnetovibrio sp. PR-2 TaxID=3120356 RepID=UPI002FCE3DFF